MIICTNYFQHNGLATKMERVEESEEWVVKMMARAGKTWSRMPARN